jgi:hypothetical protein
MMFDFTGEQIAALKQALIFAIVMAIAAVLLMIGKNRPPEEVIDD